MITTNLGTSFEFSDLNYPTMAFKEQERVFA